MRMKRLFWRTLVVVVIVMATVAVMRTPVLQKLNASSGCYANQSGVFYCEYQGKIKGLYINKHGLVRLSLYEPLPQSHSLNEPLKRTGEVVFRVDDSEENREMRQQIRTAFYNNHTIKLHVHNVHKGYGVIGYLWTFD